MIPEAAQRNYGYWGTFALLTKSQLNHKPYSVDGQLEVITLLEGKMRNHGDNTQDPDLNNSAGEGGAVTRS